MPMFLRKLKHSLYLQLVKLVVKLAPGASYTVFAGEGSSRQMCEFIARMGVSRVLVVTDKALRELGVVDQAVAALAESDVDLAYYDGVLPDPNYLQVAEGVAIMREHKSEIVVAVGGGSSIDAAKIIAASFSSDADPRSWIGFGKVKHEMPKIYAIPTTSGTGSEATMGAVITDENTHEKGVISGATLLPAAAALDPALIRGLPAPITAATGMDALTHGIEAYIGIWERGTRKEHARAAIKLIFDNLVDACNDGSNMAARDAMCMAAYYAGIAINQVNVGNVHAIAHQLGGKYGIPHGLANALVLPAVLDFCREESQAELAELALLVGAGNAGDSPEQLSHAFIAAVRDLRTAVHIHDHSEKIKAEDYPYLAKLAMAECEGYAVPRLLDYRSTVAILSQVTA